MALEKKLYVCRTEVVYYALADSENEAREFLDDAIRDGSYYSADYASEIDSSSDCYYEGDWGPHELVYGEDTDDITLGECFDEIKEAEKEAKAEADFLSRQGRLFP